MKKRVTAQKKTSLKYIFVVGGVISGVGKGVTASSIALLLRQAGQRVTALKIDPYVNVDAGTMNPTEHGEVFVLSDGLETDQDMGNYERFLETDLGADNYMTTGRVYQSVIEKERDFKYKGKCVEVVPHVPLEVIDRIDYAAKKAKADVVLIEIGGTIGEYQNILFLEAIRMLKSRKPRDVSVVMVSYLPIPGNLGEMKTKPTQVAARTLNASGILPDMIIGRSGVDVDEKRKEKIALSCNIPHDHVISAPDVPSIYAIPENFRKEKVDAKLCHILGLSCKKDIKKIEKWRAFTKKAEEATEEVRIAVVGKYFSTGKFTLSDSYLSVIEALKYSSYWQGKKPVLEWFDSGLFEKNKKKLSILDDFDGVLIPGGFGTRGIEGKIEVIRYVRENNIPYFGICYGMQLLTIEYARSCVGIKSATTHEIHPKGKHRVVDIMPEQIAKLKTGNYGGTMRLGTYPCSLVKGTQAYRAYGKSKIEERHRHRYEVNPLYVKRLQKAGLVFSGMSPDGKLAEIVELPKEVHPFFVGAQFHPEFLARPLSPHPLFTAFIKASITQSLKKK
ncbi:MAG: CTP synthase [Flavobacteriaceae bacterium]|jgi:CTP synthase